MASDTRMTLRQLPARVKKQQKLPPRKDDKLCKIRREMWTSFETFRDAYHETLIPEALLRVQHKDRTPGIQKELDGIWDIFNRASTDGIIRYMLFENYASFRSSIPSDNLVDIMLSVYIRSIEYHHFTTIVKSENPGEEPEWVPVRTKYHETNLIVLEHALAKITHRPFVYIDKRFIEKSVELLPAGTVYRMILAEISCRIGECNATDITFGELLDIKLDAMEKSVDFDNDMTEKLASIDIG